MANNPLAIRSNNPTLGNDTFRGTGFPAAASDRMTLEGTVNKTALCLLLLVATASWTWSLCMGGGIAGRPDMGAAGTWVMVGLVGGFVTAMVTTFKREWAPVTAPAYAALEGLALGGISATFEARYPGLVGQAVFATFGTLGALLLAYRSGLVRATDNLRLGLMAATGGIALLYLVNFVMHFFGTSIPMIHSSSPLGIGFSVVVVGVAALNLVLDFDFIEQGAQRGAPAYMEWYAAFGLMVTLVWLYMEILRLLSKLQERR